MKCQRKPQTTRIPIIILPPPELVRRSALERYPVAAQEVLKPLVESQHPRAENDTAARIKHLIAVIGAAIDPAQPFEAPPPAASDTEPGVLSDTYFGVARDASGCPFTTHAKAALRALHSALVDIDCNGTKLTTMEVGILLKLPFVLALFASESTAEETR